MKYCQKNRDIKKNVKGEIKLKNSKKIGIISLVAFVAIGSYLIAGTYAKYTSEISGSDTASVARWKWTIGSSVIDSAEDASNGFTFNLFDTILDSDLSSSESDVASHKIAPGTSGSFAVDLTNDSEVNATYSIAFSETNSAGIPIEYSSNGTTWVSSVSDLNVSTTPINMGASSATTTVYWRWAFNGSDSENYSSSQTDSTDTVLGFSANSGSTNLQVTATVTVTQAN